MATETCDQCNSTYDTEAVSVPSPIPDFMCAHCGTQLTEAQVAELAPPEQN